MKMSSGLLIPSIFALLITLGSMNFLLFKVMYSAYGEEYSFFVSQGINILFVIYGGAILYPMQLFTDTITPAMTRVPKEKFLFMGILDGIGGFFTAMGAVYTPGQFQTLLNQMLIPLTMIASSIFLDIRYSKKQVIGAASILAGAAVVIIPSILTNKFDQSELRWYSCLIYVASNIPMACSAVYKERAFKKNHINVLYLTQWVSIFQVFIGFAVAPLQIIPGFGSKNGFTFAQILTSLYGGYKCCFHIDGECSDKPTFLLITGYCFVNFCFNTTGLYMTKHGSAVLNSISYGLLLPLTTIMFSFQFLGPYQEHLTPYTFLGLVCVLVGVFLYQRETPSRREPEYEPEQLPLIVGEKYEEVPESFQERVVGLQLSRSYSVE